MRRWFVLLALSSPLLAFACGDVPTSWDGSLNVWTKCPCEDGKPIPDCVEFWEYNYPDRPMRLDPATCTPDAGADADAMGCAGTCVPVPKEGWTGPVLVATAPGLGLAECPQGTKEVYFGWADPGPSLQPLKCPACSCDAPESSCALPTSWDVQAEICQTPTPAVASFDAPPGWDGSCTAANAIPADKLCGGVPCVRSLSVDPPLLVEGECQAKIEKTNDPPVIKFGDDPWILSGEAARACQWEHAPASCTSDDDISVPYLDSPFKICAFKEGVSECPEAWKGASRQIFYKQITDNRRCSDCGCSPPEGGSCVAEIRVYSDNACSDQKLHTFIDSANGKGCDNLIQGIPLGSKEAAIVAHTPGACQPQGGEVEGELELGEPTTVCCLC